MTTKGDDEKGELQIPKDPHPSSGKKRLKITNAQHTGKFAKQCQAVGAGIKNFIEECFEKCPCGDPNTEKEAPPPPPRRFLYFGEKYDKREGNDFKVKNAHIANEEETEFCSNYISTTKYTPITFLPIFLFEQFRKKANFYFLIIAILSMTSLSPKSPFFSIAPLTFVLVVSGVKEVFEDIKRFEMDKEINNRQILCYRPPSEEEILENEEPYKWKFRPIAWQDLEVGDLIKVTKESRAFPADILLLQSSTNQGLCNIETANLDGETNLKIKQAISATYQITCDENGNNYPSNNKLQFHLESEAPNEKMDKSSWNGSLHFYDENEDNAGNGVGMTQMILRGCTLRNTDWIIGLVVFTGIETKLMLNNKARGFKRSNVDTIVDFALYLIFLSQFILCIFGVIAHYIWLVNNADNQWYQYISSDGTAQTNYLEQGLLNYFTFLVMLDLFVPISLYVSMELVKFSQAALINFDDTMIAENAEGTKIHASARTSNLNEELGQVDFIFSDKTGTLTENKMDFLRCHIDGIRYGPDEMERQHQYVDRIKTPKDMPPFDPLHCQFTDNRLARKANKDPIVNEFLTLLSVCHSIIPEYENEDVDPFDPNAQIVYNASSPDEKALVVLAKNLHYYFYAGHVQILEWNNRQIDGHRFYVNILGDRCEFDVYNLLEFSSARKRMSVILYDKRDKTFKLYCKGADNVIFQRLRNDQKGEEWNKTLDSLKHFAADGLRTLVCGYRTLTDKEYTTWLNSLLDAKASLQNRDILVEECYSNIECDLTLLGATAIEDRLQSGVPETIANLAVAGISIWVLTGDKVETAINIGRSCRLLAPDMMVDNGTLYVIDPAETMTDEECLPFTTKAFDDAWEGLKDLPDNSATHGMVISGKALGYVFPHRQHDTKGREIPPTKEQFEREKKMQEKVLKICRKCRAVICCRVSPKQKAQMVLLVKYNITGTITLAIGDGANDVPMIKAAHVGIGISGQEGLQAVMASDYAIAQFRFLEDLLLVHGAWDYRRISVLILYSFYKNIMFSMTGVWFSIYSGYSGTLYYDALAGSSYNMVFTAFPVLLAAVLDRPYSKEICKYCPELYENGPNNGSFNLKIFGIYGLEGVIHSAIVFYIPTFFVDSQLLGDSGKVVAMWTASTTMFSALVTVATMKMMLETRTWTKMSIIFFILSEFVWFLYAIVWSAIPPSWGLGNSDFYQVNLVAMETPQYWFCILMVVVMCLIPEIIVKYIWRMYFPTRLDIVEEIEMSAKKRAHFIDDMKTHIAHQSQRLSEKQEETSDQAHLGFADFHVGPGHSDYVMSQSQFIKIAMKKPKLIEKMQRLRKKRKEQKSRDSYKDESKQDH